MDKEIQKNPKNSTKQVHIDCFLATGCRLQSHNCPFRMLPRPNLGAHPEPAGVVLASTDFQECSELWNVLEAKRGLRAKTIH